MRKLIIAVDFDGTIVESRWPNVGPEMPGAISTLKHFQRQGHKLILWTCRTGKQLDDAVRYLTSHSVHFDAINSNLPERIKAFGGDSRKVSADVYVDDKSALMQMNKMHFWELVKREVARLST